MRLVISVLAAAFLWSCATVGKRLESEESFAKHRPTTGPLSGKTVAILVADGFEQDELSKPREALEAAGARTVVVSPQREGVQGHRHHDKADVVPVDVPLDAAQASDFDALLLPGGAHNPDALRMNAKAVTFVRAIVDAGKPVAAICHAPWTLVEAGVVNGRTLTSWPSLRTDLTNAGAVWVDEAVVVDRGLVTSRKPGDLPAFNARMIEVFSTGLRAEALEPAHATRGPKPTLQGSMR